MSIEMPKFVDVLPFYIVNDNGKCKEYSTLIDIANDYDNYISNIYHLVEGKKVKTLDITIEKTINPYVFFYKEVDYKVSKLKDIAKICNLSVSKIHNEITKFLLEKLKKLIEL